MLFGSKKTEMVSEDSAIKGRDTPITVPELHYVLRRSMTPPYPEGAAMVDLGMGCFWGAERKFWTLDGVFTTAVGYAGGYTLNPVYEEVCTGRTGHTEAVRVVYLKTEIGLNQILRVFWESHDPTQGMRQGNDVGTQYRSAVYLYSDEDIEVALKSKNHYQQSLSSKGFGSITTEILKARNFFFAEDYHQQYLAKNPAGYCGLGGTGVRFA